MEHEGDSDISSNWRARYSHQRIDKGSGGLINDSIVEIGQNTKKSPGNLRRLAVTRVPVEKPSANAGVKNSRISK